MSYLHATPLVIPIDENTTKMELLDKSILFMDKTGKLAFNEVKKQMFEVIESERLHFGYAYNQKLWVKFTLKNNSDKRLKRVVSFQTAEMIKLYDGEKVTTIEGYRETFKSKFELSFEPHEVRTYYIEAYSNVKVVGSSKNTKN